jgi:hypothetical protein
MHDKRWDDKIVSVHIFVIPFFCRFGFELASGSSSNDSTTCLPDDHRFVIAPRQQYVPDDLSAGKRCTMQARIDTVPRIWAGGQS